MQERLDKHLVTEGFVSSRTKAKELIKSGNVKINDRVVTKSSYKVKANDEIITLSTCCYDYDNARFVILGRLVRPDESTEVDVNSAVVNTDVLYSKKYYDKKKLTVPTLTSSDSTTSKDNTSSK